MMFKLTKHLKKVTTAVVALVLSVATMTTTMAATVDVSRSDGCYAYSSGWDWADYKYTATTANGKTVAYCIDPHIDAPTNGTYKNIVECTNANVKKAMYYCYGGEGFEIKQSAFGNKTMKDFMLAEKSAHWLGASGSDLYYLLTHRVVAYLNGSSTWNGVSSAILPMDWQNAVIETANAIKKAPTPTTKKKCWIINTGTGKQRLIYADEDAKVTLQLIKTSSNAEITKDNPCYSLKDAEFNVYTDKNCSDSSYIGTMVTDENGKATLSNVPAGTSYFAKETKAPKGYTADLKTVYEFTKSSSTTYTLSVPNQPISDPISVAVVKQDAENNKGLAGAQFKISYYAGYYDETTIKNVNPTRYWIIESKADGKAFLTKDYLLSGDDFYYLSKNPCIPLGTITIQEVKAPDGYKLNNQLYLQQLKTNADGSWIKHYEVPTVSDDLDEGYAVVLKTDDDSNPVQGAVYGLYSSNKTDSNGNLNNPIQTAVTNENGKALFKESVEIGTYYVQEISAPLTHIRNKNVYTVQITSKNTTKVNAAVIETEDKITKTYITKTDITGENELAGSTLVVTDKDGKEVDKWISTEESHLIKGLIIGSTYTLTETNPTDGYSTATSVSFTVNENGITKVTMKNDTTKWMFDKVDEDGNHVDGVVLQLIDSDGNIIDEWTTEKAPHQVFGKLIINKEYTLHEVESLSGYVKAKDLTFFVADDSTLHTLKMINNHTITEITKTDITGQTELAGATLIVTDKDGKIIDEWVSTLEPHIIKGLVINETYTLTEKISPSGFATAKSIEFKVNEDGSVTKIIMKDDITRISVEKVDEDNKPLKDCHLQIKDEDGKVIEEWVTDGTAHVLEGKLSVGKTYILHESKALDGYDIADDIKFTVKDTADVQTIIMVDKYKGDVKISTPDQPSTEDETQNNGSVQTGQTATVMILAIIMVGAVFVMFTTRKKQENN